MLLQDYNVEVKTAIDRHENCLAIVIPIFLAIDVRDMPLGNIQGFPNDAKPS